MPDKDTLRTLLTRKPILVAPGVYDAFTALNASLAGFSTLYVSGGAIAYTRLGRPDVGLVSMSEVAETISLIRDRVDAHLIVDADTGYGNALNVERTVRTFERAGATAIQIEDQDFPKRCGHLDGKALVPATEMLGKIKAALDARHSRETLVIARTDAVAVEGFDRAIERALAYGEAGADVLFVEAPKAREDLARIVAALGTAVPLMANMVEGGKTPPLSGAELEAIGFALGDLPRRHRARHRQDHAGLLCLARRTRHDRAVPRAHVRSAEAQWTDRNPGAACPRRGLRGANATGE